MHSISDAKMPIRKTITIWDPLHSVIQSMRAVALREGQELDYTFAVNLLILSGLLGFTDMPVDEKSKVIPTIMETGTLGEKYPALVEEAEEKLLKIVFQKKTGTPSS